MKRDNSHIAKSRPEKDYYAKYIKTQDYEPTVDETLKFPSTDDDKKDFSNQKSKKKRKATFQQKLQDHFEENWLKWVVGFVATILIWLMFDSKSSIGVLDIKVGRVQDDIKELKTVDKETNKRLQDQELNLRENKIRIENIEKNKGNR
jgi:hypothetical protein